MLPSGLGDPELDPEAFPEEAKTGRPARSGVVEDQAESVAAAGADGTDAVADRGRGPAPGPHDRAIAGGEDQAVATGQHGGGAAGLGAGALLDEQELPPV